MMQMAQENESKESSTAVAATTAATSWCIDPNQPQAAGQQGGADWKHIRRK